MIDDGDYSLHKERSYKDNYYIAQGSMQLLIAQLREGQHALKPDRFWATVQQLKSEGYIR